MSADLNINVNLDGQRALNELQAMRTALAEMSHQSRLSGLRDELRLVQSETAMIRDRFAQVDRQIRESTSATGQWRQTVTAVSSAYTAMRSIVGDVATLAGRVVEGAVAADRHARAVSRLGAAYEQVRAATNDVVSAEQALRVQQELTQSGLRVGANELATITRRAREYAQATGVDVDQALGQMTEALRGGTAEGLRRFGVEVAQGTDRVRAMEGALSRWREEQSRGGPAARTLGEEVGSAGRAFNEMTNSIMGSIAQALRLREAFAAISGFMGGWDRERQQNEREESAGNAEILRNRTRTQFFQQLQAAGARGELRGNQYDRLLDIGGRANTSSLQRLAIALQQGRGQAAYRGVVDSDVMNITGGGSSAGGGAAGGGAAGGGGGGTRQRPWLERMTDRFANAGAGGDDEFFQSVAAGADRTPGATQSTALSQDTIDRLNRDRDRGAETERLRTQAREMNDIGEQMNRSFEGIFGANRTLAQNFASTMRGAFDTATNSFKSHLSALITGRESFAQALRGFAHEVSLDIAVQSAPKALFELAEGFASQAMTFGAPNPKSVMHFTSAAMYAGLAAGGGIIAALTAPPSAAPSGSSMGSDAGTRLSAPRAANDNAGGGNHTYVINVNSALATREDVQDAVRMAQDRGSSRSSVPILQRQIENLRAA